MTPETKPEKRIVILSYGWVMIGEYSESADQKTVSLNDAYVIRRWGTKKGLGQIALTGPTKDTILDPCGIVNIPMLSVVASIRVMQ